MMRKGNGGRQQKKKRSVLKSNNRINIYDVAELADVSTATVSRVLNNYPHVSAEKKARVLEVLKIFNYMPNADARSMASMRSKKIGVMVTDVRHVHYANIAYTVERAVREKGYVVVLCNTGMEKEDHAAYIRLLAEQQVGGLIMVGSVFSTETVAVCLRECMEGIPVVMHNGKIESENVYSIVTADPMGIELALDYLFEKNRRRFVFVQDYNTWVGCAKADVFTEHCASLGIEISPDRIVRVNSGIAGGSDAAERLLSARTKFDAVIGCDDLTAIGLMKRLKASGISIPGDVAVISYNNSIHAEICEPPLTSVDNKMLSIGNLLSNVLVAVLEGREPPHHTRIEPRLAIRESA